MRLVVSVQQMRTESVVCGKESPSLPQVLRSNALQWEAYSRKKNKANKDSQLEMDIIVANTLGCFKRKFS